LLKHTFIHIQGIGPKAERKIWQRGIRTWEDFLNKKSTVFSAGRDDMIRREVECSCRSFGLIEYFASRLPNSQQWRLFDDFRNRTVYLDIETGPGLFAANEITVIGLYDGQSVRNFVNGVNLDRFELALADYELMVTFNGRGFDIPCIKKTFPGISLPHGHIDLMFLMRSLGYRGGLKRIEKALELRRPPGIEGLNGYDAVKLWQAYQEGHDQALDLLLDYNRADIVNLEPLMTFAFSRMKKMTYESAFLE